MERKILLNKAFQRGHLLTIKNKFYSDWINRFIIDETKGDIGDKGDITSNAVLKDNSAKAVIYSRTEGIVAGIEEVAFLLKESKINIKQLKNDGDRIEKGTRLLLLDGSEREILKLERPILDILSRMSGIATLTNVLIMKIKDRVPIASTRKIEWRYLDKKGVYVGGGLTHRLALWESILIKDNHLAAIRREGIKEYITEAIERAWRDRNKAIFVEIETTNLKEALEAAAKFKGLKNRSNDTPCLIMLDNLQPTEIRGIISELKKKGLYDSALLEASGGINPDNIISYAETGVDVLSLGYLTTSPKSLDIKLGIL